MNLRFTLSESDALAFSDNFYRSSATHRKARQSTRLFLAIALTPVMLFYVYRFGFSPVPIAIFLAAMVAWYVLYPARFDKRLRNHAKKQMQESSYANMFGSYEVDFDESCLRSSGPIGESKFNWEAVHRTELTEDYLFVFLLGPTGFPIPVDQIGTEKARQAYDEINRLCNNAD